jgi:hypothetical protein
MNHRGFPARLPVAGYLTALFSAQIGGDLGFAKGSGVNHTSFESGSDAYVVGLAVNDLVEGKLTRVEASCIPPSC